MDWKHLFLDFSGRINRKPFWIGMVILFLVNLVVSQVLGGFLLQLVDRVHLPEYRGQREALS